MSFSNSQLAGQAFLIPSGEEKAFLGHGPMDTLEMPLWHALSHVQDPLILDLALF